METDWQIIFTRKGLLEKGVLFACGRKSQSIRALFDIQGKITLMCFVTPS